MKLDDIAKMAIDEFSAELENIEIVTKQTENKEFEDNKILKKAQQEQEFNSTEKSAPNEKYEIIGSEEIFLKNLRERIEVLFEGLNETPKENLQNRLELTLKFLEFVLANVENRLENLSK